MQGLSAEALLSLWADVLHFAKFQLRNTETAEDLGLRDPAQPHHRPPSAGLAHGHPVDSTTRRRFVHCAAAASTSCPSMSRVSVGPDRSLLDTPQGRNQALPTTK